MKLKEMEMKKITPPITIKTPLMEFSEYLEGITQYKPNTCHLLISETSDHHPLVVGAKFQTRNNKWNIVFKGQFGIKILIKDLDSGLDEIGEFQDGWCRIVAGNRYNFLNSHFNLKINDIDWWQGDNFTFEEVSLDHSNRWPKKG